MKSSSNRCLGVHLILLMETMSATYLTKSYHVPPTSPTTRGWPTAGLSQPLLSPSLCTRGQCQIHPTPIAWRHVVQSTHHRYTPYCISHFTGSLPLRWDPPQRADMVLPGGQTDCAPLTPTQAHQNTPLIPSAMPCWNIKYKLRKRPSQTGKRP